MSPTEAVAEVSASASGAAEGKIVECLIHVRFNPNGTISEIGECPAGVTVQNWFRYLSQHTRNCYQALAGGRGLFKLPRTEVETLKAACGQEQGS
jgi:hypothetical protein